MNNIKKIISDFFNINYKLKINPELKIPTNKLFGDFTTNVAMQYSSKLNIKSMDLAKKIKNELINNKEIEEVVIKNPGFINIFLGKVNKFNIINEILLKNNNFGKIDLGKGKKVSLEFISANPTGMLHIGHARNAILGDIIGNLLSWTNHKLTREYWINDYGLQMENLGVSLYHSYKKQIDPKHIIPDSISYQGKDIVLASKIIYSEILNRYENKALDQKTLDFFTNWGKKYFLEEIKKTIKYLGIKEFDIWKSEGEIFKSKKIEKLTKTLESRDAFFTEGGALWLKTTENSNDDKNRVYKKSDGKYTYMVADIINHIEKLDKKNDVLINIFGSDHAGYENRIRSSLEWLGYDSKKLEIKFMQMVRLIKNGKEYKMSKRAGNVILINDLIKEFGLNELRYFISSKQLQTHLNLEYDVLIDKSNSSPLYYSMYSYVRSLKILNEFQVPSGNSFKFENLNTIYESQLIKEFSKFESVIKRSTLLREPQILIIYLNDISKLFHSFYNNCKIKNEISEIKNERLLLVKVYKILLNILYNLIGIIPLKEM